MLKRANQQKLMRSLFLVLGVLVVVLIVVLILIVTGKGSTEQQMAQMVETGKYVQGVSIDGVDVSGMKYEEAAANDEIKAKAKTAAGSFKYTFTVEGKEYTYPAADLGIKADVERTLRDALKWGNVGNGDEIRQQKTQAQQSGKDFSIAFSADVNTLAAKLQQHKAEYDTAPKNATLKAADDPLAQQKFTIIDEVKGVDVDIAKFAGIISANFNKGNYSAVAAPTLVTNPSLDAETLKANASLMATFYSEFKSSSLSKKERVANIKILAGIVNGTVIEPGQTWSLNDAAGPRDAKTAKTVGWQQAPGILEGRYLDQYGGGVCQVSSTIYNAAIRSEIEIIERSPHSWPSTYIEEGMDATISTGGPDLKLFNSYDFPVLIVCTVDEKAKRVTAELYGPPLANGYTVQFTNQKVKSWKPGQTIYHYDQTATPDGVPIEPSGQVEWITPREGQVWNVYKQHADKDGKVVDSKLFSTSSYDAYAGEYYINGPDPATVTPTPAV